MWGGKKTQNTYVKSAFCLLSQTIKKEEFYGKLHSEKSMLMSQKCIMISKELSDVKRLINSVITLITMT